jgi:hypothetical protein
MTEAHASGEISRARENAGPNKTPTHLVWIADNRQITGNGRKRRKKEHELQTGQSCKPGRPTNEAHSTGPQMSWSTSSVSDEQIATELLRRKRATESLISFTEYTFERTAASQEDC